MTNTSEKEQVQEEKPAANDYITRDQLTAILARHTAKAREEQKAEDAKNTANATADAIKKATEEGIKRGQLLAAQQQTGEKWGISPEFLANLNAEQLEQFDKQLNATITSRRRVQPVEITPKTSLPDWVSGVN